MKRIIYFLPLLLLYFSCSDDSSDDLPETENNTFTVEYSQSGDNELFHQDITLYGSPVGWEDSESGSEVEGYLNAEYDALPGSFSYTTKQTTPAIWLTYNVTPHNVEEKISLDVTFKFYKDGDLIDGKNLTIDNESTVTDSFEWKYFSDTGDN